MLGGEWLGRPWEELNNKGTRGQSGTMDFHALKGNSKQRWLCEPPLGTAIAQPWACVRVVRC